ncbi:MAG TPA: hypothetical protein VFB25_11045 [Gaiellaceae bacterium]|nr:hypothetical protein [Gaiellaceae bacterium]
MADPVSWLLIEPGWTVVVAGGEEVGRVEEVTGDSGADIFDGLSVSTSALARPRYVPAEQIAEITQGQVKLSLDRAGFDALGEYEEPAESIDVEPEKASLLQRAEADAEHVTPRQREVTPLRRVLEWFGLAGRR